MLIFMYELEFLPALHQDRDGNWYYVDDSRGGKILVESHEVYLYDNKYYSPEDGEWKIFSTTNYYENAVLSHIEEELSGKTFQEICKHVAYKYELRDKLV